MGISNKSKLVQDSSSSEDSEVEVKNRKKSSKSKLVEDSSSSEDSDSEDSDSEVEVNRKKSNKSKLVKDSSTSRDLNTSFDIKCEPLDEFVDEESLLIDLILKGRSECFVQISKKEQKDALKALDL